MKHWFTNILALLVAFALPLGLKAQDGPVLSAEITQISVSSVDYSINSVTLLTGGAGYSANTKVTISGGGGTGASATPNIVGGVIQSITMVSPGAGYTSAPSVVISDSGGGSGAAAVVVLGFSINKIDVTANGAGYTSAPTVTITGGGGTGATAQAMLNQDGTVKELVVLNGGGGYISLPTITFTGGGGEGAQAVAVLGYSVVAIGITEGDNNTYLTPPTVVVSGSVLPGGSAATAKAVLNEAGFLSGIAVVKPGSGYVTPPTITVLNDGVVTLPGGGTDFAGEKIRASASIGSIFYPPYQNEAYGPAKSYIIINAFARGTFPEKGFLYEYYVNGVSIGVLGQTIKIPILEEARGSWTPPEPGVYYIHVEVDDQLGNKAKSLAVRYFSTGTSLQSPLDNTLVPRGSSVVLQASAVGRPQRPNAFVQKVEFWKDSDSEPFATDLTYPYSAIYTPSPDMLDHRVEARAYDNNGNRISPVGTAVVNLHMVTPEIEPLPKVSIVTPSHKGADSVENVIANGVDVVVSASSASNKIGKVELYVDGVLADTTSVYPYKFNWKPAVAGTYGLVALAYDSKNNVVATTSGSSTSSTPVPTVFNVATPPSVAVLSPTPGTTVNEGERTTLSASAFTNSVTLNEDDEEENVTIDYVDFYVDGTYAGRDETPDANGNYSSSWSFTQRIDPETREPVPSEVIAYAIDSINLKGTSAVRLVSVLKGTSDGGGNGGGDVVVGVPPTVSLISPIANSEIQVNTVVSLIANAEDVDGKIASVQFFVDGTALGTLDTIYPYSTTWTPTALGTYSITSKAIDSDGNATRSQAILVTVKDLSSAIPVVNLTQPTSSMAVVGSPINLVASAVDSDGAISSVQFYVNGKPHGNALSAYPFLTTWTPLTPGKYSIIVRAVDDVGTIGVSPVKVITVSAGSAPAVSISAPADGATVNAGEQVRITATATDSDDVIKQVRLFVNGSEIASLSSSPYSVNWIPTNSGTYTLIAEATDMAGNISVSASSTLVIRENLLPSVQLLSPTFNLSSKVGTALTVKAAAQDYDNGIAKLEIAVNGKVVASLASSEETYPWTPNFEGIYRISAVATDNAGAVVSSKEVSVLVVSGDSDTLDTVYSGTYVGGKFAFINAQKVGGVFIAYPDSGTAAKLYTSMTMAYDGSFSSGSALSGNANDAGVMGWLGAPNASPMFMGQSKSSTGLVPMGPLQRHHQRTSERRLGGHHLLRG